MIYGNILIDLCLKTVEIIDDCPILQLPNELMKEIIGYLDQQSVLRLIVSCKRLCELVPQFVFTLIVGNYSCEGICSIHTEFALQSLCKNFISLRQLDIRTSSERLDSLTQLDRLEKCSIGLSSCAPYIYKTLEPLCQLTRIQSLELSVGLKEEDFLQLARMEQLLSLTLREYTTFGDHENFTCLSQLTRLQTLVFDIFPDNLDFLTSLSNLTTLYEEKNPGYTNHSQLICIGKLTQLRCLQIDSEFPSDGLTLLSRLRNIEELEILSLDYSTVKGIRIFSKLRQLIVGLVEISPLELSLEPQLFQNSAALFPQPSIVWSFSNGPSLKALSMIFPHCPKLDLSLQDTHCPDEVLEQLPNFEKLTSLRLEFSVDENPTDCGLQFLSKLTTLKELSLHRLSCTSNTFVYVRKLQALEKLELYELRYMAIETLCKQVMRLTNLKCLSLDKGTQRAMIMMEEMMSSWVDLKLDNNPNNTLFTL